MKVIEISNLTKIYNDAEVKVSAINGINLIVEEGEFTAIVGPSGSGKTTLPYASLPPYPWVCQPC